MPRLEVGSHWMRCVATRCGAVRNRCVTLRHFRRNVLQYAASCRMRLQDVRQRRAQCAARARHRIAMAWTYLWTFIYHHCTGQFFAFFFFSWTWQWFSWPYWLCASVEHETFKSVVSRREHPARSTNITEVWRAGVQCCWSRSLEQPSGRHPDKGQQHSFQEET